MRREHRRRRHFIGVIRRLVPLVLLVALIVA
jgi:hypothetical protein